MECKNCFSEFKIDKSSTKKIINCPYCNTQLVNPNQIYSNQVDNTKSKFYKNAKEVLIYIKENYGIDIFLDVNKTNNLFSDLAPNLYKEREVIKRAFIEGVNTIFLDQSRKGHKKDEDIVVKKTLRILKEELCITEHTAVMLVECFACVFDLEISISDIYKYSKEINKGNEKFDIERDCNEEWYLKGKEELKQGDYVEAFNSFTISAKQGNSLSKATLGIFYFRGVGCERDYEESIKLFRNAHMNDCALGKAWLSFAYKSGIIVTKNDELSKKMQREVFESMEILANHGNDDAQCFLGIAYYIGECVTQDYKKSFYWF